MHILRWIVGAALFLALLFVSLQNSDLVTLKFYTLVELAGAPHLRGAHRLRRGRCGWLVGRRDALGTAQAPVEPSKA